MFALLIRMRCLLTSLPLSLLAVTGTLVSTAHAEEFNLEERVKVCAGCHGDNGSPVSADIPVLAGQEYYYLYVQLKDYKADRRANPIMSSMVQDLSRDDMKELATHYSSMQWPRVDSDVDANKADEGQSALAAGQCSQCHSTYQGDSRVPRLAGQQLDYLLQTMLDFKTKTRLNSPAKGSLMDSFSDEDLTAMAHHLANLQ